jgi:hypothetical protein
VAGRVRCCPDCRYLGNFARLRIDSLGRSGARFPRLADRTYGPSGSLAVNLERPDTPLTRRIRIDVAYTMHYVLEVSRSVSFNSPCAP